MNAKNGGPAFPAPDAGEEHFNERSAYMGMTLRDYFAAKAMQAYVSSDVWREDMDWNETARAAYAAADAMLDAREA